jgi:hypothetical protein
MVDMRRHGRWQDRSRINIEEAYEVRHWAERLGVAPADVRKAVREVGSVVEDVVRELGLSVHNSPPARASALTSSTASMQQRMDRA